MCVKGQNDQLKDVNNKLMSAKNVNSPHFWWIISIYTIVLIGLVAYILTCRITNAEKIIEYISYASVILSITLSIFAILYTYTSNVQIQQQFEKINSAANNITSTSENLTKTGNKLDESLGKIIDSLQSIGARQEEISGQMTNINTKLTNSQIKNISNSKNVKI